MIVARRKRKKSNVKGGVDCNDHLKIGAAALQIIVQIVTARIAC